MPNIQPISDLRNYNSVLHNVAVGEPVFLTKNGRGKFAVLEIGDYERMCASLELLSKLHEGERSAAEKVWLGIDEVKAGFEEFPNADTLEAMKESESGQVKSYDSLDEFYADVLSEAK